MLLIRSKLYLIVLFALWGISMQQMSLTLHKQTHYQGCKGSGHQYKIPVLNSNRSKNNVQSFDNRKERSVNIKNIIQVPIEKNVDAQSVKACVVNCQSVCNKTSSDVHGIQQIVTYGREENDSNSGVNRKNLTDININYDVKAKWITIGYVNARSVKNKTDLISDLIEEKEIDCLGITETWLSAGSKDQAVRGDLTPTGYQLLDNPRSKGKGGGVAVVVHSSFKAKKQATPVLSSCEIIETLINTKEEILRLGVVYRPPSGGKSGMPVSTFLEEFHEYIDSRATLSGKLILLGDLNFHFENPDHPDTKKLKDLLYSLNLDQHVKSATHIHGHCLDLVISRSDGLSIDSLEVHPPVISDHSAITFKLPGKRAVASKRLVICRKLKDINMESFEQAIINSSFVNCPSDDLEQLTSQYNTCLTQIMDTHAPVTEKLVVDRSEAPWFSDECKTLKIAKRKAERTWRKSKLTVHLNILRDCVEQYKSVCHLSKAKYFRDKINENSKNQKELFKITNSLLHRKKDTSLPSHIDPSALAKSFAEYFEEKIDNICKSFCPEPNNVTNSASTVPQFHQLQSVSTEQVKKIIEGSNSKYCHLDPMPTPLLKSMLEHILPSVTKMINISIKTSTFPSKWKCATVVPLLKKSSLDPEEMKNYRPVSNLPYISKITERVVLMQLDSHMSLHSLENPCQSAYRTNHSTETALVKIVSTLTVTSSGHHPVFPPSSI